MPAVVAEVRHARRGKHHDDRVRLKRNPRPHQDLRHLDNPRLRPIAGGMGRLERIPQPKKGAFEGKFEAWGEVIVKNGDTEFRARNKIVGQGLRHMVNLPFVGALSGGNNSPSSYTPFATNDLTRSYIRVGTGGGSTLDATTALAAQVATNPSSTTFIVDNPVGGQYRAKFIATWSAGVLSAVTVSEIGIFGQLATVLGTTITMDSGSPHTGTTNLAMFARLSSADAEFTAFTINTSVPLTIEYRVIFTFT